jgi:predicted nuclease with TOPRIM domain
MTEMMHNHEQLTVETQVLQARISDLEHENATLKAKLQSMESQMLQNRVDELEMENAALKAQFQECSASTTEESAMNTS